MPKSGPIDIDSQTKKYISVAGIIACILLAAFLIGRNLFGGSAGDRPSSKWMFDLAQDRLIEAPYQTKSPSTDSTGTVEVKPLGPIGSIVDVAIYACDGGSQLREGMTAAEITSAGGTLAYMRIEDPENAGQSFLFDPTERILHGELSEAGSGLLPNVFNLCGGSEPARFSYP